MRLIVFIIIMSFLLHGFGQNIGVNAIGATPNTSSILDLNTGNTFTSPNGKGLLPPNVALTGITDAVTVTGPATSLLVYNSATANTGTAAVVPGFYYWDGVKWVSFSTNPVGIIVMWSGLLSNIPAGWALCDGTLGTPNLLDRFILSVNTAETPGAIGGNHFYSLTTPQLPTHTHTGTTGTESVGHTHSGTTSIDGAHNHTQGPNSSGVFYSSPVGTSEYPSGLTGGPQFADGGLSGISRGGFVTSTNGAHSHTINTGGESVNHTHSFTTSSTGSGTSIDNRPSYYKLAFIMKL